MGRWSSPGERDEIPSALYPGPYGDARSARPPEPCYVSVQAHHRGRSRRGGRRRKSKSDQQKEQDGRRPEQERSKRITIEERLLSRRSRFDETAIPLQRDDDPASTRWTHGAWWCGRKQWCGEISM